MAFNLEMYPVSYIARYNAKTRNWDEQWLESDTIRCADLQKMDAAEREAVYEKRNMLGLGTVNYTTQYGMGCFEGMKAFPSKSGAITIFRPDRNAKRFADSMRGLYSPAFPEEQFIAASVAFLRKNAALGYVPAYDASWEQDNFSSALAVYMRPFMYSESAIGVGVSKAPSVIICATTVSSYFKAGNTKAVTTKRIRATPHGTGNIKCASNYVISALAKKEAEDEGFMEVVFLDAVNQKYIEEGSSCNIFFHLSDGTLVTPDLGDTILPGITRSSVLELAKASGVKTAERKIAIDEVMKNADSCFVTGTAAGITPIESITHNGTERVFNNRKPSELSEALQKKLKGIQYGTAADTFGWNKTV